MSEGAPAFLKDTRSSLARLVGTQARASKVFDDFPGSGERFKGVAWCLWALSGTEISETLKNAYDWCRKICGWSEEALLTGDGRGILAMSSKAFQLALALRDSTDPAKPFAEGGAEVLSLFEPDEIGAMYERFLDWQQERSPIQRMTAGEVESFVEALGKGWTAPDSLSSYDSVSVRFMLLYTARALHPPTKDSSSDTGPASDSSTSSTTLSP